MSTVIFPTAINRAMDSCAEFFSISMAHPLLIHCLLAEGIELRIGRQPAHSLFRLSISSGCVAVVIQTSLVDSSNRASRFSQLLPHSAYYLSIRHTLPL